MSQKKYLVTLTADERGHLGDLLRQGKASALVLTRARILLKADQSDGGPALDDAAIADDLEVGLRTVSRVRERLVERGFEDCLRRKRQDKPSRERTLDGTAEAQLIALACSDPPDDRAAWTMRLLADKLVELKVVDAISDETVRRAMKKMPSSRGSRSSGASRPAPAGRSSRRWRT
jgi:homeodomain-containing protein